MGLVPFGGGGRTAGRAAGLLIAPDELLWMRCSQRGSRPRRPPLEQRQHVTWTSAPARRSGSRGQRGCGLGAALGCAWRPDRGLLGVGADLAQGEVRSGTARSGRRRGHGRRWQFLSAARDQATWSSRGKQEETGGVGEEERRRDPCLTTAEATDAAVNLWAGGELPPWVAPLVPWRKKRGEVR